MKSVPQKINYKFEKKIASIKMSAQQLFADLSMNMSAKPSQAQVGEYLIYTISVYNHGPCAAENVHIVDVLPSILSSHEYSVDDGTSWEEWGSTCIIHELPAKAGMNLLVRGILEKPTLKVINAAFVVSDTPESNLINNYTVIETRVGNLADISVVKTAYPNPVYPCNTIIYTIAVSNAGPDIASNVLLKDRIPEAVSNPQYSFDEGETWYPWKDSIRLGNMIVNETITMMIMGTIRKYTEYPVGQITNIVTVSSDTPDPNPGNNRFTITTNVKNRYR